MQTTTGLKSVLIAVSAAATGMFTLSFTLPVIAWQPDTFEVYCGEPASSSTELAVLYAFDPSQTFKNPVEFAYYDAHYGEDADIPGEPGCLSPHRAELLEKHAHDALVTLSKLGFSSPSLNDGALPVTVDGKPVPQVRLGPIVQGQEGDPVVRLFITSVDVGGETLSACYKNEVQPQRLSVISLPPGLFENRPSPIVLRLIAHELVHVIQFAQPFYSQPLTDHCIKIPWWILDGTADALSVYVMNSLAGTYEPPLSVQGARSIYGLRPYHKAFTWNSGVSLVPDGSGAIHSTYRTSSFFMHLADHYFNGGYSYLADFFAVPDSEPVEDDWLGWLDDQLSFTDGANTPLYLVFPDFAANYALWGSKKYEHIGDKAWRKEAFGGCQTVTLSRTQPTRGLVLNLEPISAQCFEVQVGGLRAGEIAQVKTMAYADSETEVDNLHLATATLSPKPLSLPTEFVNCYSVAERNRGKPACLLKPYTSLKKDIRPLEDDGSMKEQTKSGKWVKTWASLKQEAGGSAIRNLYLMAHTPTDPNDKEHDNLKKQKVALEIALDVHTLSTTSHGNSGKATASVNGNRTEPVPMAADEGAIAEGMAGLMSGDPDAFSKLPFLMNLPAPPPDTEGEGIYSVAVSSAQIKSSGSESLEPTLQMTLILADQRIPFGATGTYPAYVSGMDQSLLKSVGVNPMAVNNAVMVNLTPNEPSGRVEVVEFSEQLLHLRVGGDYCRITNYDDERKICRRPQSFSGEVIKPFGWVYDTTRPFVSLDTPGMEIYRHYMYRSMNEAMGNTLPILPPDEGTDPDHGPPGDGGESGSVAAGQSCDCSCKGFDSMQALAEKEGSGSFSPEMAAMLTCSTKCMSNWVGCATSD